MKQKPSNPSRVGQQAEQAVRNFLQQHGLTFVTSNYRCRSGEIDLIMRSSDETLVLVEVRLRSNPNYGSGADTVTREKQRRLSRTALHYLQRHPQHSDSPIRFDVVSVSFSNGGYQFDWIREAFWPGDR